MDLGQGELAERGLALRASGACDADGLVGEALRLVALVVVEEREGEDAARLGAGRPLAARSRALGGALARRIRRPHRLLRQHARTLEIARIEGLAGLREHGAPGGSRSERGSGRRNGVSGNVTPPRGEGQSDPERNRRARAA